MYPPVFGSLVTKKYGLPPYWLVVNWKHYEPKTHSGQVRTGESLSPSWWQGQATLRSISGNKTLVQHSRASIKKNETHFKMKECEPSEAILELPLLADLVHEVPTKWLLEILYTQHEVYKYKTRETRAVFRARPTIFVVSRRRKMTNVFRSTLRLHCKFSRGDHYYVPTRAFSFSHVWCVQESWRTRKTITGITTLTPQIWKYFTSGYFRVSTRFQVITIIKYLGRVPFDTPHANLEQKQTERKLTETNFAKTLQNARYSQVVVERVVEELIPSAIVCSSFNFPCISTRKKGTPQRKY